MRPQRDQPTDRRASGLDGITRWRTWLPLAFVLLSLVTLVIVPPAFERRVAERREHVSDVIEPMRALTSRIRVAHARQFEYIVGYHLTGEVRFRAMYAAAVARQRRSVARLRRLADLAGGRLAERVAMLDARLERWHGTVESAGLLRSGLPSAELLARLSDRYAAFAATAGTAESVESAARERAAEISAGIQAAEERQTRLGLVLAGMALFSAVLVAWLGVRLRRASLDLERRAYNESELRSIAESLNTATEIDQVLRIAVTRVLEATGTAGAYVERVAPDGRTVEVAAARGRGTPPPGTRVAYRGSVTRAAIGGEDAVPVGDIERFAPAMAPHLRESCGDCVMLVAPLASADEPLGALVALRHAGHDRPFTRDEIFRASAIGFLTAVALRRTIAMDEAESERRERTLLLESTTEGICGLDRDGRLKFLNHSAAGLLDLSGASPPDRTLHAIVHPHHAAEDALTAGECPLLDAIRTGRRIRNGEDVFWTRSGRRLPVLYSLSPVVEEGGVTGAVVVFSDVTERRRAAEERERLLEREREAREEAERRGRELERLMESRARFVRGLSHDVKNPLGAAEGHARLLAGGVLGPLADEQLRSVRSIEGSIETALGLIEDVVELARAEAGQLSVRRERIDPVEVVRATVHEYRGAAADAGLVLSLDMPPAIPTVETDPTRIREILGNLLSNAVKYTPEGGGVRIGVRAVDDARAPRPGHWIAVDVADTGPGIPADKLEEIFEEFTRQEADRRGRRGAGLGLAISRRLARLLGGDVTVESEVGRGSTFTLWLPCQNQPRRRK